MEYLRMTLKAVLYCKTVIYKVFIYVCTGNHYLEKICDILGCRRYFYILTYPYRWHFHIFVLNENILLFHLKVIFRWVMLCAIIRFVIYTFILVYLYLLLSFFISELVVLYILRLWLFLLYIIVDESSYYRVIRFDRCWQL